MHLARHCPLCFYEDTHDSLPESMTPLICTQCQTLHYPKQVKPSLQTKKICSLSKSRVLIKRLLKLGKPQCEVCQSYQLSPWNRSECPKCGTSLSLREHQPSIAPSKI